MATFTQGDAAPVAFEPLAQYDSIYTAPGAEVGRGASGVVRRASRRSDGLPVAVKTMDLRALRLAGGGGFSIPRLRREVDVLRSLRHPAIVRLYGAYGDQDTVLLVMELVEGRELFDAILSQGRFEEANARAIFGKLCAAVAYMHARNIIHRDVKPENVLVTGEHEAEVKLVDFGLSKLVAGSMAGASRAHTMVGTPSYLAPEIESMTRTASLDLDTISKDEDLDLSDGVGTYDNKVDAWSLGVTLYVMLVARFPVYDRDGDGTILGARVPEDMSPDARRLLLRLLAADPLQRLSATDALDDPWLKDETQLALTPPASPPEKKKREQFEEETKNPMGLAHAHAALVASSALGLPPELRSAGLDYHERALASRALATKLRGTALLVLEMIDDLKVALDARNADAAREVLGAVRRWTADLEKECAAAKKNNLAAMRRLAQAVGEEEPLEAAAPAAAPETHAPRLHGATAAMSLDETPGAPTPPNAARPGDTLDLKNDEVLELMLPVTADDLRAPPVSRSRPAQNHLLRCLGELHVVFTRMELVWSKVEVSLDTVLKRSEALEVLLGFADTPALKGRLDVRLAKFKAFWAGLAAWDLDVAVPGVASSAAAA